jgi:CDP-diacylglycerol--glycerol-3-phosphate 3-phosphatidyltransferase
MSMLYTYKPQKDRVLYPACRMLRKAGLTPNMVTAAGVILSACAGVMALYGHLYAGIVVFFAGACLDALDGSLARATGRSSEFGRYFDSIADRGSELLFVAGAVAGGAPVAVFVVVTGSIVLLAARVYNHSKGLNSDAAMFGRPERLAFLIVGLLAPAPYNVALFITAGLLCLFSSAQVLAHGVSLKKSAGTH